MISREIKTKIENLFAKKKYDELINFATKHVSFEERSAGLASVIGTCFFSKTKKDKNDLISALNYFEEAYLKEKKGINGLSGIINFINLSIIGSQKSVDFVKYLNIAEKYYEEAEDYFGSNPDFLIAAKKLFWFQLNNNKLKQISNKIISNQNISFIHKSGSIFFQNYIYNWSQQKYSKQAVINSKNFSKYKVKKINEINFKNNNKINIGFVCGDFTDQHSLFYFLKDTIKYLDKKKIKVFLFSFNRGLNFLLGQKKIKSIGDEFIELDKFNNQECVKIIQDRNINILIDVMGFSFTKRVEIFNSRIAPIQISWLATCNTIGFETIDYLIADKNLISELEENQYPEKILKLPNIWISHCGYDFDRVLKKSPYLTRDFFTFGSLNNFHKISDEVVSVWSEILERCPKSKLILKSSSFKANSEKIIDKFKKYHVDKQIILLSNKNYPNKKDHLEVYNNIDLALDTFPYNGVTTTFEALWMSVPVLVLKGFNFNSNCGFSIIRNSKFDSLISYNQEDYIAKAVHYYNNRHELSELKKNLFSKILSTPLFQTKNFSENFAKHLLSTIK